MPTRSRTQTSGQSCVTGPRDKSGAAASVSSKARAAALLGALLLSLAALPGCVNLGAVRDFAGLSEQASQGFRSIVDDMYQSCLRSAEFDPPASGETPEAHCAGWKALQPGLLHADAVLAQYMLTLGKLASDEAASYDKNADALKGALESTTLSGKPLFDTKQVDAFTGLASFLLKAATDGYRRRQLASAVSEQNGNVQRVTEALATIVAHDYAGRLTNEETALDAFRNRLERPSSQKQEPLAVEMGERQVQESLRELAKRREAAGSYLKVVNLIAKGHGELYEHQKDLGSKDLMKLLWNDAAELAPLIQKIQKAF